jgi:hypothetical protein
MQQLLGILFELGLTNLFTHFHFSLIMSTPCAFS